MKSLLFFLHKIGPYHHARFNELAKHVLLTVVEILPESNEYDWNKINNGKKYKSLAIEQHKNGIETRGKDLKSLINIIFTETKPDYCIVTGWNNRSYFAALKEAKSRNVPVFCISDSTYSDSKRNFLIELVKAKILSCFDGFLVAGTLSKEYLKKLHVKVPILAPWDVVDNVHFQASDIFENKFHLPNKYILCVSRFIWEKNLRTLVEAFIDFKLENKNIEFKLVLVGSGPLKKEIENYVISKSIDDIIFLPFVQYPDLPGIYKNAEALILPSLKDTWGLVINEAMAAGIPVLVSNKCGCVPDLIENGKTGYIFEPSKESIKNALAEYSKISLSEKDLVIKNAKRKIEDYRLESFALAVKALSNTFEMKKINFSSKILLYIKSKC